MGKNGSMCKDMRLLKDESSDERWWQSVILPVVLKEAVDVLKGYKVDLSLIGQETDPTPYGSLQALVGQTISGFKPVTHGQMRFTKINVVDKFGQVVHAIDPMGEAGKSVYPALGEVYDVDAVPGDTQKPNVVDNRWSSLDFPEYVQLPPSINQPARINAHFVVRGDTSKGEHKWRPTTEFDKPIWGWVVANYVNNGLPFFLPDGRFYREVRSAGSDIEWLPFGKPPTFDASSTRQLDALVKRLVQNPGYLSAFTDMIRTKLSSTIETPTAYSRFLNSLVGRPLALANTGWSLELNTKSHKNESTLPEQQDAESRRERGLLPGDGKKQYRFPLKFGDESHNYDGLVGYFEEAKDEQTPIKEPGNDLNLEKLYTYYSTASKPGSGNPLAPISTDSYPSVAPFWLDPRTYQPSDDLDRKNKLSDCSVHFERDRNANLQIFGVLFDPFAPIVGFSSILPPRRLVLPPWTWQTALKQITTFFHAGPVLLTDDVPQFQAAHKLLDPGSGYDVKGTVPGAALGLPALNTADWAWLQPYDFKTEAGEEPQGYMALDVAGDGVGEKPAWTSGPLTAVEGYLQLKESIEQGPAAGK